METSNQIEGLGGLKMTELQLKQMEQVIIKQEEAKIIEKIDNERKSYTNSEKYGGDMCQLLLQQLNLKRNEHNDFGMQSEIYPLFSNIISNRSEAFSHRNVDLLKDSLDKSFYANVSTFLQKDDNLTPLYISELVDNEKDSFLILPIPFITSVRAPHFAGAHVNAAILKKEDNMIKVELFDKATKFKSNGLLNRIKKDMAGKNFVNYIYEIDNDSEKINKLSEALKSGREGKENVNDYVVREPFKLIENFAEKGYEGDHLSRAPVVGNCLVKGLTAAIKYELSKGKDGVPLLSNEHQSSNEVLNEMITDFICDELKQKGFKQEGIDFLRQEHQRYSKLKESRKKFESFPLKLLPTKLVSLMRFIKKSRDTGKLKQYYKQKTPQFQKNQHANGHQENLVPQSLDIMNAEKRGRRSFREVKTSAKQGHGAISQIAMTRNEKMNMLSK